MMLPNSKPHIPPKQDNNHHQNLFLKVQLECITHVLLVLVSLAPEKAKGFVNEPICRHFTVRSLFSSNPMSFPWDNE